METQNKCFGCVHFISDAKTCSAVYSANLGNSFLRIDGFCRLTNFAIPHYDNHDAFANCENFKPNQ